MDRAQIFTVDSGLPKDDNQADDQPGEILKAFRSFVLEFRLDNNFIYRYVHSRSAKLPLSGYSHETAGAIASLLFYPALTVLL
jgi:hypothetical protein